VDSTDPDALPCQVDDLWQGGGWGGDPDLNGHMEILAKLRQNPIADQYYISRYIDLRNNVFSCENLLSYLDTVVGYITPEMPQHIERWGGTLSEWEGNVEEMRQFIIDRCAAFAEGLNDCYDLTGPYDVTFTANPTNASTMQINSLAIDQLPYTGEYFGGIDILVDANPVNTDWVFDDWTTDSDAVIADPLSEATSLQLTADQTITANFISTDIWHSENDQTAMSASPSLFSGFTNIHYSVSESGNVVMNLFGENGQLVSTLINNENHAPGTFDMKLDLSSSGLAAGMYYIQLTAGSNSQTVKLVYEPR
jgi:hypothetical protein